MEWMTRRASLSRGWDEELATSGTSRARKTKEQRASGHACTRRLASGDLGEELDPALPGWDQYAVGEVVGKRGVDGRRHSRCPRC